MHSSSHRRDDCANCGASLRGEPAPNYCPACGQETLLHPPTLLEFLHEFVTHYVALEGALWRSLAVLILRPGRLTLEYLAGRRRRYVLPLRLYLTASFVFFLIVKVFGAGSGLGLTFAGASRPDDKPAVVIDAGDVQRMQGCIDKPGSCDWWTTQAARFTLKAAAQANRPQAITDKMGAMAPYAIFAMLPVFAGIVMLAYRGRRRNYGEHFVFSLHLHAFWFFALLAMALMPPAASGWISLVMAVYGAWALRSVYAGRRFTTLLRALAISLAYGAALLAGSAALAVAAVALG